MDLLATIEAAHEKGTNKYIVEVQFRDKVLGTQPKNADVMKKWLESKHLDEATIEKQQAAMSATERIADESEAGWTGFFTDEIGPWIGTYQVKAMLREMLSTLGITVEKRGSKQTYQHLMEIRSCTFDGTINGDKLHFHRGKVNEVVVTAPDGVEERTGHVVTPQGPRSILKRHDYVEHARLRFLIVVPAELPDARRTAVIGDDEIARCLAHAGGDGLGCSRSQGFGAFDVVRCERITDNRWTKPKPGKPGVAASDADAAE